MGMFANPLSHAGYPPGVTGTPTTQPSEVRAATAAEVSAGVLNNCYVSPATASSLDAGIFASPPVLGSSVPNGVNATTLAATTGNITTVNATTVNATTVSATNIAATLTQYGVVFGGGTLGNLTASAVLASGQTIVGNGAGSNPSPTYFSNAKVTYVPSFNSIPIASASTGGAAAVTINTTNLWSFSQWGAYFEAYNNVALQAIVPALSTTAGRGLNLDSATGANSAIIEITEGNSVNTKNVFNTGTSPAFYVQAAFNVATLANCLSLTVGFRDVQAYQATGLSTYTDYATIGVLNSGTAGEWQLQTQKASGGQTTTDTTQKATAATTFTLRVNVSSAGVVTYLINGVAPTVTAAFTFTASTKVIPFIQYYAASGGHTETDFVSYQCGLQ